jgi:glucose/arabinose dehydrogenase
MPTYCRQRRIRGLLVGIVTEDGDVWGRPVGVAVAQDGSLLVTDDAPGTIWRVANKGN